MKKITNYMKAVVLAVAVLAVGFPTFSYGATYAYVNQSGQVSTVQADSPAMAMAAATNKSTHSGVMLISGSTGAVLGATYGTATYAYVNQSGIVVTISASSSAEAFAKAVGIDESSGVMLLSNTSGNNGIVGDHVSGV